MLKLSATYATTLLVLAASGGTAKAQQIQAYSYDVHGRLQATTAALANSGSRTLYGLDTANNRTSKQVESAGMRAATDRMTDGETLLPGQRLISVDNRFIFILQEGDGNAVIYGPSGPLWSTNTAGRRSTILTLQHDGNIVISGAQNEKIWDSGTATQPGARLIMQNDGNLVLYVGSTPAWSSGTGGH